MKRLMLVLTLVFVFLTVIACNPATPAPTSPPPPGQGNQPPKAKPTLVEPTIPPKATTSSTGASAMSADFIKEVATAKDKDAKTNAPIDKTTAFPAGQKRVVLTVRVENAPDGVKLKAVWYTLSATGSGTKLFEHSGVSTQKGYTGYAYYQIERTDRPGEPFPNGSYRVELWMETQVVRTIDFTIGK